MTFAKYKRLCLVLFVPLLIAGFFVGESMDHYLRDDSSMFCNFSVCRDGGKRFESFYNGLDASAQYFDVFDERSGKMSFPPVKPKIRLHDMIVLNASVKAISTTNDALQNLVGRKISSMSFSEHNNYESFVAPNGDIILACSRLFITDEANTYSATCNWGKEVFSPTFTAADPFSNILLGIVSRIDDKKQEYKSRQIIGMAITYPIFIYLFLIISGLVWLVRRAARYVSAAE